jgi:hypothetical protein
VRRRAPARGGPPKTSSRRAPNERSLARRAQGLPESPTSSHRASPTSCRSSGKNGHVGRESHEVARERFVVFSREHALLLDDARMAGLLPPCERIGIVHRDGAGSIVEREVAEKVATPAPGRHFEPEPAPTPLGASSGTDARGGASEGGALAAPTVESRGVQERPTPTPRPRGRDRPRAASMLTPCSICMPPRLPLVRKPPLSWPSRAFRGASTQAASRRKSRRRRPVS